MLIGAPGVVAVRVDDDGIIVDVNDVTAFRTSVLRSAKAAGVRVEAVQPLDEDLESVFRYLVSRRW